MLIQPKSDVLVIATTIGMVIGKVVNESETSFTLDKPIQVVEVPNDSHPMGSQSKGQRDLQIVFVPMFPFAKQVMTVLKSNIVFILEPGDEMLGHYIAATSGIQVVKNYDAK